MSFRHPHHRRSSQPEPPGDDAGDLRDDTDKGRRRLDVETAFLAGAVDAQSLHCIAQEICSTTGGDLVGLDVVARGPVLGRVVTSRQLLASIDDVEALAAANGLLVAEAVSAVRGAEHRWSAGQQGFVSITLDARFVAHELFLETIKEATRSAGLEPRQLLLSVEADLGLAGLWPNIQRLKSHGVQVALEGFRLGAPATDLVSRFSFDVLRVDVGTLAEAEAADLPNELTSIVRLAADLRCQVMADRFSSRGQVETAIDAGCDLIVCPPADGGG